MIEMIDVHKRFGRRKVLNGISFTASKGEITCLIGINGAGKSTILKAIMGLTPVHKGAIRIGGQAVGSDLYKRAAFIPDHLTMPGAMRAWEALRFMADFYPNWDAARAAELMSFFKLNSEDRIGNMSKGTAAKLNWVLGLALDTDFVLMDEPFAGIDMFSREAITEVFSSHLIEDRGVLLTTHEISEMEHLLDKAVIMNNGAITREFHCDDLRREEGKSVIDVMREVYRA
ncbi:multidrug ABC transporter ATP-binding protein [Paenibacillus swuensis]|uniref:Multidrug ABC transporter ATP-binding protein n=1 Tax=Paenibacillus swuensis TaxID=1178515 RepID=A0A172TGK3_9BACL|nr:ABC transporter ATP-binding protein [Paenibacillus swuensis]ANE46185.1 multidrug ABC transporter ATP-binding protein [Paenibacillus swuensis]